MAVRCLVSLWGTTDAADTIAMVVDDGSPAPALVDQLAIAVDELGYLLHRCPENGGFSRAVNVGLSHAREAGADAVLVNADIEFPERGWLDVMRTRTDAQERPAAVVGARLLYPNGLIQHGGIYFSVLRRDFFHRFQFAPANLAEAMLPTRCPVTGALKFIRHETPVDVGLYDERYRMNFEDVDYCLRVFERGLDCIYEPVAMAHHHESYFRRDPTPEIEAMMQQSLERMFERWASADLREWIPEVL